MAQIYKTFTKADLDNKQVTPTTTNINQTVNTILSNFIQYIKVKHA